LQGISGARFLGNFRAARITYLVTKATKMKALHLLFLAALALGSCNRTRVGEGISYDTRVQFIALLVDSTGQHGVGSVSIIAYHDSIDWAADQNRVMHLGTGEDGIGVWPMNYGSYWLRITSVYGVRDRVLTVTQANQTEYILYP
jgi:hypothetical protein